MIIYLIFICLFILFISIWHDNDAPADMGSWSYYYYSLYKYILTLLAGVQINSPKMGWWRNKYL